ncbi:hypothetical protein CYMTET_22532, partial [Cymbomonas tetramitiformis]
MAHGAICRDPTQQAPIINNTTPADDFSLSSPAAPPSLPEASVYYGLHTFYALDTFYGARSGVEEELMEGRQLSPARSPEAHTANAASLSSRRNTELFVGLDASSADAASADMMNRRHLGEGLPLPAHGGTAWGNAKHTAQPSDAGALLTLPFILAQRFSAATPFDLANKTLIFHRRGDVAYRVCLEEHAGDTQAAGATAAVEAAVSNSPSANRWVLGPLAGEDDGEVLVQLNAPFPFFSERHTRVRVEAAGRLTFGSGVKDPGGLDGHVAVPSISALFRSQLTASHGGVTVWYEEVDLGSEEARLLVTWQLRGSAAGSKGSTVQAALYFTSGRIQLSWGDVDVAGAEEAVVGVSHGTAVPPHLLEYDLSTSPSCAAAPDLGVNLFTDGESAAKGDNEEGFTGATAGGVGTEAISREGSGAQRRRRSRAAERDSRAERQKAAASAATAKAEKSAFKELFWGLGEARPTPFATSSSVLDGAAVLHSVHERARRLIVRAEQLADEAAGPAGQSQVPEEEQARRESLYRGGPAGAGAARQEPGSDAFYYPYGVQREVPEAVVTDGGWELCYDGLDPFAAAGSYLDGCHGEHVLLAARSSLLAHSPLALLAAGRRADALQETTSLDEAVPHNGAFWYHVRGHSMGFAPTSAVSLHPGDLRQLYTRCEARLSWWLKELGEVSAGGRAGCTWWNDHSLEWRKVAYHRSDQLHLPADAGIGGALSTKEIQLLAAARFSAASAYFRTSATSSGNIIYGTGRNSYGQLADGTTTNRYQPVQVMTAYDIVNAAGGYKHSAFVSSGLQETPARCSPGPIMSLFLQETPVRCSPD